MEKKIYYLVNALKMNRVRRRRFTAVMIVLSMIVSSSVVWQLHSTGNAMSDELLCGMSEHVHTAECLATELACSEDHEHTQECYKIIFTCDGKEHLHTEQCRSDISADTETAVDWELTLPEEMSDDRRENLAAVAESQLGYTESTKNFIIADDGVTRKGYTRYGEWYGNPYGDWNALFAYFCLYYAGITENELPYGSGCWAWTEELKKAELFSSPEDITVSVGDLVFLDTDSDEKPDRVGIVSGVKDEKTGITFTAIEGDLGGAVDKADYSLADEMLAGVVSLDNLSYNADDFEAVNPYAVDLLADNSGNLVQISCPRYTGINNTSQSSPIIVHPGETFTLKVELKRGWGSARSTAYYTEKSDLDYFPYEYGPNGHTSALGYNKEMLKEYEYYPSENNRLFYSFANIWGDDDFKTEQYIKEPNDLNNADYSGSIYYGKKYSVPENIESKTYTLTYNNCNFPNMKDLGLENIYIKVEPNNVVDAYKENTIYYSVNGGAFVENTHTSDTSPLEINVGDTVDIFLYTSIDSNDNFYGVDGNSVSIKQNPITQANNLYKKAATVTGDKAGSGLARVYLPGSGLQDAHAYIYFNVVDAYKENTIYYSVNGGGFVENNTTSSTPLTINVGDTVDIFLYTSIDSNDNFYRIDGNSVSIKQNPITQANNLYKKAATVTGDEAGSGLAGVYLPGSGLQDAHAYIYFNVTQQTGPELKIIKPIQADNSKYNTPAKAYSVQPGDSVTLVGNAGKGYEEIHDVNLFNQLKASNNDKDLQFVHIGNKYIATYARFWGLNENYNDTSLKARFTGRVERYDFDSDDNLIVYATYTANEIGITNDNKYVVTFADGQGTDSIATFWLQNDATMLYVYSTVGWRDIDRVNEAFGNGDSGNGKYWKNSIYTANAYGEKCYIVHPGDWIYLAGVGTGGSFGEVEKVEHKDQSDELSGIQIDDNARYINQNIGWNQKPPEDKSNIGTYVMLKMPDSVNGNANYRIVYKTNTGEERAFYFRLGNESAWQTLQYDHADIEISDGSVYEMVAEHWVKPDGTEIKTVRTYTAAITKVFKCLIHLNNNQSDVVIESGEYSSEGTPGNTQYELTSKYQTDRNGNRIYDNNGNLMAGARYFTQNDVVDADFYVNVHLIPESEITTITYPDGSKEEIINAAFDSTTPIDVENVQLNMNHQSVIDAVNKCPDHSGLDFTIRDEKITTTLRSGSALIEAYKIYRDDQGHEYDLKGDEFEFELYALNSDNSETFLCSSTNVAEGYVYFDRQFYIDLNMDDTNQTDTKKEFYYLIKEKIPNNPDNNIIYSDYIQKVRVTVEETTIGEKPTYKVTVDYLNMSTQHDYDVKDKNDNFVEHRQTPAFINIQKTYLLPSTGGGGTTIFYLSGTALMLTAAALLVRRRRREEKQP